VHGKLHLLAKINYGETAVGMVITALSVLSLKMSEKSKAISYKQYPNSPLKNGGPQLKN